MKYFKLKKHENNCDDNYYFTFSDWPTINATVFEIKPITNFINEYPINGRLLYGFDKN